MTIDHQEIPVCSQPVTGSIRPPGSKSLTNRAIVCAALCNGQSTLKGALDSEDTRVMASAWRTVGVDVQRTDSGSTLTVSGTGSILLPGVDPFHLNLENSGTSIRFLTAALTACGGSFQLDGIARMRQRPIGDLVEALTELGGSLSCADDRFPPISIHSKGLKGGTATVSGKISSQFLSGILMAAPLAKNPVEVRVAGGLVSRPYVDMTLNVMASFGCEVECPDRNVFRIKPQSYQAVAYEVEPDASAASYFWAAAAITGGDVTVQGLSMDSLQGDVKFVHCLEQMGCEVFTAGDHLRVVGRQLKGVNINMADISDTVQTIAAVALYATGPTTITGVAHNRHKETDRIEDLATELRRLGASVQTFSDGLKITPGPLKPTTVQTYNDHRMAMSLALVGLRQPGIQIADPGCTVKTYPNYFKDLFCLIGD